MDRKGIVSLVSSAGLACVSGWCEPGNEPSRPYAVLNYLNDESLWADNKPYVERDRWQLDVVADSYSEGTRGALEAALVDGGIAFSLVAAGADAKSHAYRLIYRFTTNKSEERQTR